MHISQLRKHIIFTSANRKRLTRAKKELGFCGEKVWIDKNVEFQRFPKNIFINDDVIIKEGARLCSCNEKAIIKIGKNTTIGFYDFLFASERIEIGNDCLIAPFTYIVDSKHQIKREKKINLQPIETSPIIIGNDVWIASNVTILKGITIADGAVIAATDGAGDSIFVLPGLYNENANAAGVQVNKSNLNIYGPGEGKFDAQVENNNAGATAVFTVEISAATRATFIKALPSPGAGSGRTIRVKISDGSRTVVLERTKNWSRGTTRSPDGPVIDASAPNASNAGGASAEGDAVHALPQMVAISLFCKGPNNPAASAREMRGRRRQRELLHPGRGRDLPPGWSG